MKLTVTVTFGKNEQTFDIPVGDGQKTVKWLATVASQRFSALHITPDGLNVTLDGTAGELVTVRFARRVAGSGPAEEREVPCVLPSSGRAVVSTAGSCTGV